MVKLCPFCDSELSETLWCEQCKRYVVLYKTGSAAPNVNAASHAKDVRAELYQRFTVSLKTLQASKISAANVDAPLSHNTAYAGGQPLMEKPERDNLKLILIGSLLLISFALVLAICANIFVRQEKSVPVDTASLKDMDAIREPVSEMLDSIAKKASEHNEPVSDIYPSDTDEAGNSADTPSEENTEESSLNTSSDDWKKIMELTAITTESYGGREYHYYASKDIAALGLQCDYYHLEISRDTALDALESLIADRRTTMETYEDMYANCCVDAGDWYYTTFQSQLSYSSGDIDAYINYDTGSEMVHYISFIYSREEAAADCAGLLQKTAALASPEYSLSAQSLLEQLLDTKDILMNLDAPDPWHEEYVYQDSHISISMTYDEGACQVQVTSRKYADDTAQGTLNLGKSKS